MVDSKSKVLAKHIASKSIKLHNAERNFEQPKNGLEFIFYLLLVVSISYFIYDFFLLPRLYDRIVEKLIHINRLWVFITLCSTFILLCLASSSVFFNRGNKEINVRLLEEGWVSTFLFIVVIGFTHVLVLDIFNVFFSYFFTFIFVMLAISLLMWFQFFICSMVMALLYILRKLQIYFIGESLTQDVNELNHNISPVMLPILNSMGGGTLGEIYNEVNKSLDFVSIDVLDVLLRNHENVEVVKFDEYVCYKSKLVSGGSNMKTVILDDE